MCLDGVRTGAAWTGLELVLRVFGWGKNWSCMDRVGASAACVWMG